VATNTERIDELAKLVAKLTERLDNVRADTAGLSELRTRVALLEQHVNRLVKNTDEASHWRLSLLQSVLALIVGAILTIAVQLLLKHFWP
jgi:hypothetical protein